MTARDDARLAPGAATPPVRLMYWVRPGLLMAGCHPGHVDPQIAQRQLRWLLDAGLRCFVDLMAEDPRHGFTPYAPLLQQIGAERGLAVEVLRFPIDDCATPALALMDEIQQRIAASLDAARPVYVHCWGGRGRTGLVVAGHLLRIGAATPESFREVIGRLRGRDPGDSPETEEQAELVREWWRTRGGGTSPRG